MVAMLVLLDVHVPPVVALLRVVVLPLHALKLPVTSAGNGFTDNVTVAVAINPFPSVMVTVYTVVADTVLTGVAVTEVPVVAESAVEGDQV